MTIFCSWSGPRRRAGWSCQTRRRSGRAVSSVREVDVRADARRRQTPLRSRARPAALVLQEMQGHPERRLRRREDRADLVGLEFALQDDPSACQFRFGVFEVVDFISEMADDRSLAILELWHAETGIADLNQLQARFTEHQTLH